VQSTFFQKEGIKYMNKEMNEDIFRRMLDAGRTPEEIYEIAKKKAAEMKKEQEEAKKLAAEQKKKEKAVAGARAKVVEAMKEYSTLLYGVEPDIKLMDAFNADLKLIEQNAKGSSSKEYDIFNELMNLIWN